MPARRLFATLIASGLLLAAAGLALWWSGADLALHRALTLAASDPQVLRIAWFTALGGLAVQGPLALAAVALLAARRRAGAAAWLFATVVSGRLLVEAVKLAVHRPRPPVADRLELVTSWSFPSSHSAGTMLTCLALALLSGRGWPALATALLAAGAIGWSRIALGVHWPGDVLAGWGFGLVWTGLALRFGPPARRRG